LSTEITSQEIPAESMAMIKYLGAVLQAWKANPTEFSNAPDCIVISDASERGTSKKSDATPATAKSGITASVTIFPDHAIIQRRSIPQPADGSAFNINTLEYDAASQGFRQIVHEQRTPAHIASFVDNHEAIKKLRHDTPDILSSMSIPGSALTVLHPNHLLYSGLSNKVIKIHNYMDTLAFAVPDAPELNVRIDFEKKPTLAPPKFEHRDLSDDRRGRKILTSIAFADKLKETVTSNDASKLPPTISRRLQAIFVERIHPFPPNTTADIFHDDTGMNRVFLAVIGNKARILCKPKDTPDFKEMYEDTVRWCRSEGAKLIEARIAIKDKSVFEDIKGTKFTYPPRQDHGNPENWQFESQNLAQFLSRGQENSFEITIDLSQLPPVKHGTHKIKQNDIKR